METESKNNKMINCQREHRQYIRIKQTGSNTISAQLTSKHRIRDPFLPNKDPQVHVFPNRKDHMFCVKQNGNGFYRGLSANR